MAPDGAASTDVASGVPSLSSSFGPTAMGMGGPASARLLMPFTLAAAAGMATYATRKIKHQLPLLILTQKLPNHAAGCDVDEHRWKLLNVTLCSLTMLIS